MKREASVNLFQYWNRLRDGRRAPRRTEIEPADIKSLLGDTFILESNALGDAVFRLAGTRLCAIYGRELKGSAFASLWKEKDSDIATRLVRSVFTDKAVVVLTYRGMSQTQRSLALELLLLPLDGGLDGHRALGIVSSGARPFWLGVDPVVDTAIDTVRVVDHERELTFLNNRPPVPVPPRTLRVPENGGARRFRHLLVLPGGKMG